MSRQRIVLYEAAYEGVVRILYVMGRWGEGKELGQATDLLKDLAHRELTSGLVAWLGLETYPAVLALYAYGIGLVHAGRYEALHGWLATPIRNQRRDKDQVAVQQLLLNAWDGCGGNPWKSFDGVPASPIPLSEYLHLRFKDWILGEFPSSRQFTRAFQTFETLGAMVYLAREVKPELLKTSMDDAAKDECHWMPMGRVSYQEEEAREVFSAIFAEENLDLMSSAGFGYGRRESLTLMQENLRRFIHRARGSWR
ncbi:MAG: hypothetical protein B7Z15_18980 [Rhizobiales bacterium 32-66-8]|nr:MAG: hypothetical protein B7Z15_18980 [Rhizobiales bacterium 32-66-8]